ncbi:MAG: ankyrin repeat domain-containing protein [Eubacteriales bacterium]
MITVTIYNDMSKYQFLHFENAYNIGWHNNIETLSFNNVDYIDDVFLTKLKKHCEFNLNLERGGKSKIYMIDGKKRAKGFGEIRILDLERNIRYASPNLIYDDIIDKLYIPPKEFVEAVKQAPLPTDAEYIDFLSRYNAENLYGETEKTVGEVKQVITAIENYEIYDYLKNNPNILNCVTIKGSLLNYTIESNKQKEAEFLINQGINLNTFDGIELITAINMKLESIAKILLDENIFIKSELMATNPIFVAIWARLENTMESLIIKKPELLQTYTNEFVRNWTVLDAIKMTKNEKLLSHYNEVVKKACYNENN